MKDFIKGKVQVGNIEFDAYKKIISSANIIEVIAGTTGHRGGDSGHGCRTYFSIKDLGSTDMSAWITDKSCGNAGQVEIAFGGDCELDTFISALEFVVGVLKNEIK